MKTKTEKTEKKTAFCQEARSELLLSGISPTKGLIKLQEKICRARRALRKESLGGE